MIEWDQMERLVQNMECAVAELRRIADSLDKINDRERQKTL